MVTRTPHTEETVRQLKEELHKLTRTIEELVSATADDSRSSVRELRERADKRMRETREHLGARGEQLYDEARDVLHKQADVYDRYVHDNPWTGIGIGAAAGFLVGLLIARR